MEFFKKIWLGLKAFGLAFWHVLKTIGIAIGKFFKRFWLFVWNKIKTPHGIFLILFYIFFAAIISGTITLVILVPSQGIFHYILYVFAAISLAYFVYSLVYFTPKIKQNIIKFLKSHKLTNELLSNYGYRTFMFSIFSFALNIAYVIFQGILAFSTLSSWYISITAYYLILSLMKGNVFFSKKRAKDNDIKEAKTFRFTGIMFMFLTLALSGMIVLIYTSNMYFEYAGIMIFVAAAYTFLNLTLAIINIFKAKKQDDLHVENIRNINLVHAVFSIIVLQVAMFQAFSPENNTSIANGLTGAAVSIVILFLGILMIIKANKNLKHLKEGLNNDQKTQEESWF